MERVAILSDTHIPDRERAIPEPFRERVLAADHAIHAGDFRLPAIRRQVEGLADGNLTAVAGNADPRNIGLPAVDTLRVEDVTFVVTHGDDRRGRYDEYISAVAREEAGEGAVGVFGHTHRVQDTAVDGVRLLNPGSATGARPADRPTMLTIEVDGDAVDVTVNEA